MVPLLPPKQAINKSREDMERINKDIIRSSVDLLGKKYEQVEEDYDLPPGGHDDEGGEDYDLPPVSHRQMSYDKELQEDYDEPSHAFNYSQNTPESSYFSTPRKEYDEDYEEDDGETFETPNQTGKLQRTPIPAVRLQAASCSYDDYDQPNVSHTS